MQLLFRLLIVSQLAAQTPFWETKPPADWTGTEIETLMTDSPWGAVTTVGHSVAFLASARPLREAEEQLFRRQEQKGEVRAEEEDYHTYITNNPGKHIVVAVRLAWDQYLADPKEMKSFEKEWFIRVGKQKIKALGHFPPTQSDPYLRVLFPRVSLDGLKVLSIGLYVPGLGKPFQDLELEVKDMKYHGALEY